MVQNFKRLRRRSNEYGNCKFKYEIKKAIDNGKKLQNLDTIDFILKTIKSCINILQLENCYIWVHNLKNIEKITGNNE